MRVHFQQEHNLYQGKGLALLTSGGCTGSTYGIKGWNMFRRFLFTFLWWTFSVSFYWNSMKDWKE